MAEQEANADAPTDAPVPGAPELLRATLEKIVFFEWRVGELTAELAAARSRAEAAEVERAQADEAARAAGEQAQAARLEAAAAEAERVRLAALLARPPDAGAAEASAAEIAALRERSARLSEALDEARRQIARQKDERARWLNEMIAQARSGDEAPAALAQFISELRGEVIALRERLQAACAALTKAGLALPPGEGAESASDGAAPSAPASAPSRTAVDAARALWDEGRLGGLNAALDQAAAAAAALEPAASTSSAPAAGASRALAEQCLRGLASADPARRAQAAKHLAALPLPAAAPALAAALSRETAPQAKAALARALVACGHEGSHALVQGLLASTEPPLVRLAALEALACAGGPVARAALEEAARDPAPAVRRRAAALALERGGCEALVARLSADTDATVRAAAEGSDESLARAPARAPAAEAAPLLRPAAAATPPEPARALRDEPPAADDPRRDALHAVRASLFGLTTAELGSAVGLEGDAAERLAEDLLREGWLSRRGRRLVAGEAAPQWEQGGAAR